MGGDATDSVQRFIKDSGGNVVVNSTIADAYETSNGNLETFLNNIKTPENSNKGYTKYGSINDIQESEFSGLKTTTTSTLTNQLSTDLSTANGYITTVPEHYVATYAGGDATRTNLDYLVNGYSNAKLKGEVDKPSFGTLSSNLLTISNTLLAMVSNYGSSYTPGQKADIALQNSNILGVQSLLAQAPSNKASGFTTSYDDSAIRQKLFGDGTDTDHLCHFASMEWNSTTTVPAHHSVDGHHIDEQTYEISAGNSLAIKASLDGHLNTFLDSATIALKSCFAADFYTGSVKTAIDKAASDAKQLTIAFYDERLMGRSGHQAWDDDADCAQSRKHNVDAQAIVRGTNNIAMGYYQTDDWFLDDNQVLKTFLKFFDAECRLYKGNSSPAVKDIKDLTQLKQTLTNGNNGQNQYAGMMITGSSLRDENGGKGGTGTASGFVQDVNGNGYNDTYDQQLKAAIDKINIGSVTGDGRTPFTFTGLYASLGRSTFVPTDYNIGTTPPATFVGALGTVKGDLNSISSAFTGDALQAYVSRLTGTSGTLSTVISRIGTSGATSTLVKQALDILSGIANDITTPTNTPGALTNNIAAAKLSNAKKQEYYASHYGNLVYDKGAVTYYTKTFNEILKSGGVTWGAGKGYKEISNEAANSSKWLQAQIEAGVLYLYTDKDKDGTFENVSWDSGDSTITEKDDEKGVAKAKAEYDATINDIKVKETKLDLELKNIDTEHSAIQSEIESVKKVIDKNIERTLKILAA